MGEHYSVSDPATTLRAAGHRKNALCHGVWLGILTTLKHNLIVRAKTFSGNPFDGHTLNPQLEQTAILMQDSGVKPVTAYVDLGYRGFDADTPGIWINHRGKRKPLNAEELKLGSSQETEFKAR